MIFIIFDKSFNTYLIFGFRMDISRLLNPKEDNKHVPHKRFSLVEAIPNNDGTLLLDGFGQVLRIVQVTKNPKKRRVS